MGSKQLQTITLDGVDYVRQDSIASPPDGDRHIVILDRGFIYEGILGEDGEYFTLSDCANVRRWEKNGTGGMLKSARDSGATLDECPMIKFAKGSEVLMVPTPRGWRGWRG